MNKLYRLGGFELGNVFLSYFATMIGGGILQRDSDEIFDSARAVMIGGIITGTVAGGLAVCLPDVLPESSKAYKIGASITMATLFLAAEVTAPLIGNLIFDRSDKNKDTFADEFTGWVVLLSIILCVTGGVSLCVWRDRFFSREVAAAPVEQDTALRPLPV